MLVFTKKLFSLVLSKHCLKNRKNFEWKKPEKMWEDYIVRFIGEQLIYMFMLSGLAINY